MAELLDDHVVWDLGDWVGNAVDDDGVLWKVTGDEGWATSAPARNDRSPRARRDGSFRGRSFRDERVIVLEGKGEAPSKAARFVAEDRLAGLFDSGQVRTLTVTEPHLVRTCEVELDGPGAVTRAVTPTIFEWRLQVAADDPLRYGPEQGAPTGLPTSGGGLTYPLEYPLDYGDLGVSGQVTLTNPGSAPAPIRFDLVGAFPQGFEISAAGRRLLYTDPVAAGQLLTLDGSDGSVLLEGTADRSSALVVAQWPVVPARGSVTLQLVSLGGAYDPAASMTAYFRPAWW